MSLKLPFISFAGICNVARYFVPVILFVATRREKQDKNKRNQYGRLGHILLGRASVSGCVSLHAIGLYGASERMLPDGFGPLFTPPVSSLWLLIP